MSEVCLHTSRHLSKGFTDEKWAGSRKFRVVYKKALSLEQKTASGSNTLVEKLLSWVTITHSHGLRDNMLSDATTLEQHQKLWMKARDSVRAALGTLKNEPAAQAFYRSDPPLVSTRRLSVMKRWLMGLVCFP